MQCGAWGSVVAVQLQVRSTVQGQKQHSWHSVLVDKHGSTVQEEKTDRGKGTQKPRASPAGCKPMKIHQQARLW
jgi:hypothetical protein